VERWGHLTPHFQEPAHWRALSSNSCCLTSFLRARSTDTSASRAIRPAEVGAARTMIERTEERFGLKPERLVADTAYGAAPMLNWLVEEKGIAPHIPVFDKSKRDDGTFSRSDFQYDPASDVYHCPGGKPRHQARGCGRGPRGGTHWGYRLGWPAGRAAGCGAVRY
jgi:hypothetical protein